MSKTTKTPALDQGVPAAYPGNDGKGPNFGIGMDAACKADMAAARRGCRSRTPGSISAPPPG